MIDKNLIMLLTSKVCPACGVAKEIYRPFFNNEEKYIEINIDNETSLADSFNIRSVPTLLFIKDGIEFDRINGVPQTSLLKDMYKDFLEETR